jgi:hypothetical protein
MRIPSGVTDQYIYFVAVDSTDFATRETGLSSFTVYRSRNGGATAAMTPTINETDATNMPGVYELLLDEDMTIDSGDDSQEMVFHITQADMAPITRTIELYRPKITAGYTLGVESDGDLTKVNLAATVTTLTGHTAQTGDSYARIGAAGAGLTGITGAQLAADQAVNATKIGGATVTATTSVTFPPASTVATTTGAVGSVTGAVGSVTGLTASNLDATVSSRMATTHLNATAGKLDGVALADTVTNLTILPAITANWITATGITDGAFTATKFAASSLNGKGDWNTTTPPTVNAIWDEALTGHVTADSAAVHLKDIIADTNELQVDDVPGLIAALNDLSAAEVNAEVDTAIETYHLDHLLAVDYDPASPPGTSTALLNELIESDAGVSRFTVNALENGPSGSGASAASIADAVWEEAIADHSGTSGSTAEALSNASSAGDPWSMALPGAYGAGTAGEILGDWKNGERLDLILDSRMAEASIDTTAGAIDTVTNVTNEVTADVTKISGSATAADNLELSTLTIVPGIATGTPTTTTMVAGALTEDTDDHYKGRIIIWTSGVLQNQATDVTGYTGSSKTFTFTATTEPCSADDTFILI